MTSAGRRLLSTPMWEHLVADPTAVDRLVDKLVAVQRAIHSAGTPPGTPNLIARTASKRAHQVIS